MKRTVLATLIAITSIASADDPSGAMGPIFYDLGLSYGAFVPYGGRQAYVAVGNSYDALCGIHPLGSTDFVWFGRASETPVLLEVYDPAIWGMTCITPADGLMDYYLLYSVATLRDVKTRATTADIAEGDTTALAKAVENQSQLTE